VIRAGGLLALVVLLASASASAEEDPDSGPASGAARGPAAPPQSGPVRLTLPQLLAKAREVYPGIAAGRYSLQAAEAQLSEARRAWIPQGTLDGLAAPAPEIRCGMPSDIIVQGGQHPEDKAWREAHCLDTPTLPTAQLVGIRGIFVRAELNLAWPVYTFGKLSSAIDAAHAGVLAGQGKLAQARATVEQQIRQAYYGLKLAREIRGTVKEGKGYLDDAMKKIKEELESGKGNATVTDLRRLQVLVAEVDSRSLEVDRGEALALASLRVLIPTGLPRDFDVDEEPLAQPGAEVKPLDYYVDLAHSRRPELKLLDAAVAARKAAVGVQQGSFYPDLLLVGRLSYAYTSSADLPQNAYYNNPLNGFGFGGGIALRLTWDYALKLARLSRARAELAETGALRRQALGGIDLEVAKARLELEEAQRRVELTHRGERSANAWINTVAQNFAIGLAETRDFSDALMAFFQMRLRWLQAIYDAQIARAALIKAAGTE
jgi:outer membrane protein TolC